MGIISGDPTSCPSPNRAPRLPPSAVRSVLHKEQSMQMTDILAQMGGLQSMARELGVSETQAASAAAVLIDFLQ